MSLTDGNSGLSAADVAAVMNGGNGGNGWGWGNDGGGWWFLIILFLFASGGWGNGGFGGGGAMPYIGQQTEIQRGFDHAATSAAIGNLSTQVGQGFADAAVANCQGNAAITAAITGGQYATAQAITGAKDSISGILNANQLAMVQGQNTLAMALQQCCCDNKSAVQELKYVVAQENCADRQAISDGLRDLMAQNTANTNTLNTTITNGIQAIKDDLCQDRLDAANRQIQQLQTQLNMANLAASQTEQTARLIQDNNAQTAALIARMNQNCCGTPNFGCGCGAA